MKKWQLVDPLSTKQTHRVCTCTLLVAGRTKPATRKTKENKEVKNKEEDDPEAPSSLVGRAVISPLEKNDDGACQKKGGIPNAVPGGLCKSKRASEWKVVQEGKGTDKSLCKGQHMFLFFFG